MPSWVCSWLSGVGADEGASRDPISKCISNAFSVVDFEIIAQVSAGWCSPATQRHTSQIFTNCHPKHAAVSAHAAASLGPQPDTACWHDASSDAEAAAQVNREGESYGSTAVVALQLGEHLYIAHAGARRATLPSVFSHAPANTHRQPMRPTCGRSCPNPLYHLLTSPQPHMRGGLRHDARHACELDCLGRSFQC